jgi:hypothetical protein
MSARRILPSRRPCLVERFEHDGFTYFATVSYFPEDGALAEVFLTVGAPAKPGTAVAVQALDGAIILSLALQYGMPVDVLMGALARSNTGYPVGPFGRLLELLPHRVTFDPQGQIIDPRRSAA